MPVFPTCNLDLGILGVDVPIPIFLHECTILADMLADVLPFVLDIILNETDLTKI